MITNSAAAVITRQKILANVRYSNVSWWTCLFRQETSSREELWTWKSRLKQHCINFTSKFTLCV